MENCTNNVNMKDFPVITNESILEAIALLKYDEPSTSVQKKTWFEKLMNRYGWHRKVRVYVVDSEALRLHCCNALLSTGQFKRKLSPREAMFERELSGGSVIGERVMWKTIGGVTHTGILKEWDSNVAIIEENGKRVAVDCGGERPW